MMSPVRLLTLVSLAALVLIGCSAAPEPLASEDIEPKVRVVSSAGVGTEVTVVLHRGTSLFATYRLLAGERLIASAPDGSSVELVRGVDTSAWLRRNAYVGLLPEVAPRQDVTITFERPGEESLVSFVRIPGEIRVTRPLADDRRTFGESFSVAWDSLTSDDVELRYHLADCDGLSDDEVADLRIDNGFASLFLIDGAAGLTTTSFDAPSDATACAVDLAVGRVSDQIALDPAFGELRGDSRAVRVTRRVPLVIGTAPVTATADIAPKVRVVSTAGVSTEVTVVLFRAGVLTGTYELGFGERLTVTPVGGETVTMRPGVDRSVVTEPDAYVATLPPLPVGAELIIALERDGVTGVSAPATRVRIPGEINVTEPVAGAELPFGTTYSVRWEPLATGQVELRYDLQTCEGVEAEAFEDAVIARARPILPLRAGDLESTSVTFPRPEGATRCEAYLLVGRTGDAIDLDPAFRGLDAASRAVRVSAPLPLVFSDDAP